MADQTVRTQNLRCRGHFWQTQTCHTLITGVRSPADVRYQLEACAIIGAIAAQCAQLSESTLRANTAVKSDI